MSKEYLEAFEVITGDNYHCDEETFYHNKAIVEQALQRLEQIDNSNSSEAFECLDKLEECAEGMKDLPKSNWIDLAETEAELDLKVMEWVETIKFELFKGKQALLKAQEPKHYLKCDDLEFDDEWKYQEVKLNGTKYTIKYKCGFDFFDNYYEVIKIYNQDKRKQLFTLYNNEQFFNDLHLERVEE